MAFERRYSTHGVGYTIRWKEKWPMPVCVFGPVQPCKLLVATIGADADPLEILCSHPHDRFDSESDYFQFHQERLIVALSRQFPFLPRCCAGSVAGELTSILQVANASHHCLGGALTPVHMVDVDIHPLSRAPQLAKTATNESVYELMVAKERSMAEGDRFERVTCVICMDDVETHWSSLTMPCSHVFHQHCLVRWLNTSHVCPLCRYELPSYTCQPILRSMRYLI